MSTHNSGGAPDLHALLRSAVEDAAAAPATRKRTPRGTAAELLARMLRGRDRRQRASTVRLAEAIKLVADDVFGLRHHVEVRDAALVAELSQQTADRYQLEVRGAARGDGAGPSAEGHGHARERLTDFLSGPLPAPALDSRLSEVATDVGALLLPAWDSVVLPHLAAHGNWEPGEGDLLRAALRPGDTVLVCGAHVGYHALTAARAVGSTGRVVAFEPDPLNYSLLRANLTRNGASWVLPLRLAVAAESGPVEFTRDPHNSGDHRAYRRAGGQEVVTVQAVAIDDLWPEDQAVRFVFMDLQGTDHRGVQGLTGILSRWRPELLVEFWPPGMREAGDDPAAAVELYRGLGYDIAVLEAPELDARVPAADIVVAADGAPGGYVSLHLSPRR